MNVERLRRLRVCAMALCCAAASPAPAMAADRYALIVTGAAGGPEYAQKYDQWRTSFVAALRERFGYPDDHVLVLADTDEKGIRKATRENVRAAMADLRQRASKDDVVLVLLVGHGTASEADEAKFNLVGPDLSATEWADLMKPIAGRLVFVDTASGSAPFLRKVSARGRIVVTATDSAAQQYETVFPEFFLRAFTDTAADADKNGNVSIWEAFSYASDGVRQWYLQRGRLQTERPLLDDTGGGVGKEAQSPGADGSLARATYLAPEASIDATGDSEMTALLRQRADVQRQIEMLKARKSELPPEQYDAESEKLLLDLARLDSQIRSKR